MFKPVCPSCGAEDFDNYCSHCGEKAVTTREKTFSYFVGKFISAITFADNKMLRTLLLIFRNPGKLSSDFSKGRRVMYTAPISLFFIGNIMYFLFPVLQTFNTTLEVQISMMPYSQMIEPLVQARLEERGILLADFSQVYNEKSGSHAKLLIISIVLYMTFGYMLFCRRKDLVFGDHFVSSLEFNIYILFYATLMLTIISVMLIVIAQLFGLDIRPFFNDSLYTILAVGLLIYFFFRSLRTMYAFTIGGILVRTVLMILWFGLSLQLYRFELFWVTFWTT